MTGRITLEELHTSLKSYIDSKKVTSVATQSANGLMSASDKKKLDGIATGANNYTHPSTHDASMITQSASYRFVTDTEKSTWNAKASTAVATTSANGLMAAADKTKLNGIATGANNYTHPSTHAASMITQSASYRFVTDTEKSTWNAKASTAVATQSANGLMAASDKKKLDYLNKLMVAVSTFAELKSAVTAASSQPTMIFVKAGTYNFTETLYLPSYTRLVGVGEVIFQSSSSSVNCYICNKSDGTSGAYTAAYDIVVENITFEGLNRVTALTPLCFGHASHIQIIDCTFRNLHVWHMLELNAVENAMVYNCAFDNYGNTGSAYTEAVQLDGAVSGGPFPWFGPYDNTGCRDIEFNSCRWSNIGGKCIGNHTFVEGMPVQNVKFINNTIYKADTVLNLSDVQGMVCSGNYAEDCNFFINCTNQRNDVYNIFVDNNEFYGRYKGSTISETEGRFIGINIAGNGSGKKCKKLIVTNNSINDIWFHGIGFTMDDVVISNNIFRRVWKNGIYAYGGWSVSITGNLFYDTAYETDSRGAIVIGNSAVLTQYVIVANNNVQNRNRIIIGSNTSKCIVANNIGAVVNNGGSALVSNTGNYEL